MTQTRPATGADLSSTGGPLAFCCPRCKGPLLVEPERYRCAACARDYPVVLGIPDFRVFPDPYIDYADDHGKAQALAADCARLTFAKALERYWELTPDVPRTLVRRYVRHAL